MLAIVPTSELAVRCGPVGYILPFSEGAGGTIGWWQFVALVVARDG